MNRGFRGVSPVALVLSAALSAALFQAGELYAQPQAEREARELQKEFYSRSGKAAQGSFQILPKPAYRKTFAGTDVEWLASDGSHVYIQIVYRAPNPISLILYPVGNPQTFYLEDAATGRRGELVYGYWVGHRDSSVRLSAGETIRLRLVLDRIEADTVSIMEGPCNSRFWCFRNLDLQNKISLDGGGPDDDSLGTMHFDGPNAD